jgi:hypothetical protein
VSELLDDELLDDECEEIIDRYGQRGDDDD